MLANPAIGRQHLGAYARLQGSEAIDRIREAADPIRRKRVLHLSASNSGTYYSAILAAAMPILAELDLDIVWTTAGEAFAGKRFANVLSAAIDGDSGEWSHELAADWREQSEVAARRIEKRFDLVMVHDPVLLRMKEFLVGRLNSHAPWIWHCHLDLRDCEPRMRDELAQAASSYAGIASEHPDFLDQTGIRPLAVIPPVIDPFGARNRHLPPATTSAVLRRLHIRPGRPLLLQVSPFDGWDDPVWGIQTFNLARKRVPGLQLLMVATRSGARSSAEDPFGGLTSEIREDPDILLFDGRQAGDLEINALQGAAHIAIHHGVRRGFSAALLEASWKGRPVLAGDSGVLADQVIDGKTGFVFTSFEDAAERIRRLVRHPELADTLGFAGHRSVQQNHLVIRWVEDYIRLMASL